MHSANKGGIEIATREMSFKSIYRSREWLYTVLPFDFHFNSLRFSRKIVYEENRSDGILEDTN